MPFVVSNVNGCFRAPPDLHYTESVVDTDRRGATYELAGNTKRNRTMSPSQIRKTLSSKRASWDNKKKQRLEEEMRNRRLAREQAFLNELYSELPHSPSNDQPQYRPTGSCHSASRFLYVDILQIQRIPRIPRQFVTSRTRN